MGHGSPEIKLHMGNLKKWDWFVRGDRMFVPGK